MQSDYETYQAQQGPLTTRANHKWFPALHNQPVNDLTQERRDLQKTHPGVSVTWKSLCH